MLAEAPAASAPAAEPASAPAEPTDIFALMAQAQASAVETPDSELLFVGSKGAGKSTLIHSFLQKDETPKPSTPLEYRFARRSAGTSGTVVSNVWELGGGAELSQLLKVVLLPERLASTVVAITLDLSEPESALGTLLQWLEQLRRHIDVLVSELKTSEAGMATVAAARKASEQLWAEHPDAGVAAVEPVQPLGVPLVILANKWDAFEANFSEGEYRKMVCRALRFFAHQSGASLVCTKQRDKASMTVLRNLLYHHVFGTAPIRAVQLEHSRPLVVPASSDTFGGIGKPPTVEGVFADTSAEKWKGAWEYMFKPKDTKREAQDLTMVEAEQFAEEAIDELRRHKRADLVKQRKAAEFEAKMTREGAGIVSSQAQGM